MRFVAILLTTMLMMVSCKKVKPTKHSICFTRTNTRLKIENNTDKVLYITSFGQSILPLID